MTNELQGKDIAFVVATKESKQQAESSELWRYVIDAGGTPKSLTYEQLKVRKPHLHEDYDGLVLPEGLDDLDFTHMDKDVAEFKKAFVGPDVLQLKIRKPH